MSRFDPATLVALTSLRQSRDATLFVVAPQRLALSFSFFARIMQNECCRASTVAVTRHRPEAIDETIDLTPLAIGGRADAVEWTDPDAEWTRAILAALVEYPDSLLDDSHSRCV